MSWRKDYVLRPITQTERRFDSEYTKPLRSSHACCVRTITRHTSTGLPVTDQPAKGNKNSEDVNQFAFGSAIARDATRAMALPNPSLLSAAPHESRPCFSCMRSFVAHTPKALAHVTTVTKKLSCC